MQIGTIQVDAPFFQAALSGYSDYAMRAVARAHGAPLALHEVIVDRLVLQAGVERRRALAVRDDDHPVGGQLMGAEPAAFGKAAAAMVEAGYDFVDVNFGCPVPKVLGRCRGGFLLGEPPTALRIVDAVLDAAAGRVPVTLKMRRGMDASPGAEAAFFEILDGAFARGVAAITVHGRSVRQRYRGPSDWGFLTRAVRHAGSHPVFGSGDVFGPFAVQRMLAETGVAGVSVARGCIGNPFVFGQARALLGGGAPQKPTLAQQRAAIEQHWRVVQAIYAERRRVGALRRHGIKYARLHPEPVWARDRWVSVRGGDALGPVLRECYDESRFGRGGGPLSVDMAGDHAGYCGGEAPAVRSAGGSVRAEFS